MAKGKSVTKPAPPPDNPWGLSTSSDPLERLCNDAIALLKTADYLIGIASDPSPNRRPIADIVPLFCAKFRAVFSHEGPEWKQLADANEQVVDDGPDMAANSHVELAARLAYPVYDLLLEAESGWQARPAERAPRGYLGAHQFRQ